ncbi:DUF6194 family protein [Deinococcus sp.]|uniref:DUF6194 family protein n=1 Tax=Deinococcus sp. TaxID=47478 RepID=UPI003B5BB136
MNEQDVLDFIHSEFQGVLLVESAGNFFVFYSPNDLAAEQRMPFATVMTNDINDGFSDLNRPGVYRLNVGVERATFAGLFGVGPTPDFTALDQLLPHPVYAASSWVCVLNPGPETFRRMRLLIAEAYALAVRRVKR